MTLPPEQYRQMERHVPELEAVRRDHSGPCCHWLAPLLVWGAIAVGLFLGGIAAVHVLAALQDAATPSSGPSAAHPASAQSGAPQLLHAPATVDSTALDYGAPRTISGTATWYCLSGSSACTRGYGQSDLVAAIDTDLGFRKGDHVTVTYRGRSVTVRIVDVCACPGDRLIDLTSGAFRRLADLHLGVIPVSLRLAGPRLTLPPTSTEGGQP